jgi:hypothetical protein
VAFWYDWLMARSFLGARTAPILPLVLLIVTLLQDLATYKIRQHVADVPLRVGIIVVMVGVAYAIAGDWLGPWIKRLLTTARQGSRQGAGALGLWIFYAAAYGAVYWAYLLVERRGPAALLPAAWR